MSSSLIISQPVIAQATPPTAQDSTMPWTTIWFSTSIVLGLALVGVAFYGKLQLDKKDKTIRLEQYKTKDIQKKLMLALTTIKKMETNPDLVHSREFNLDYLRMRMDEQVFHYAIINQVKVQIKQLITVALRPNTSSTATVGVANTSGRNIDEIFDVYYETETQGKRTKRILFRIQIKLTKLPTQSTSNTIQQIIMCIEKYLNPSEIEDNWQPAIQGRVVALHWDQKAKPTPLLVLEQLADGANVSFRSTPAQRQQQLENQRKNQGKRPPTAPM
jgi:hypothetical protein